MTPFRSEAQRKYLFANKPELAREFEAKTPENAQLPEHVEKPKARKKSHKPKAIGPAARRRW